MDGISQAEPTQIRFRDLFTAKKNTTAARLVHPDVQPWLKRDLKNAIKVLDSHTSLHELQTALRSLDDKLGDRFFDGVDQVSISHVHKAFQSKISELSVAETAASKAAVAARTALLTRQQAAAAPRSSRPPLAPAYVGARSARTITAKANKDINEQFMQLNLLTAVGNDSRDRALAPSDASSVPTHSMTANAPAHQTPSFVDLGGHTYSSSLYATPAHAGHGASSHSGGSGGGHTSGHGSGYSGHSGSLHTSSSHSGGYGGGHTSGHGGYSGGHHSSSSHSGGHGGYGGGSYDSGSSGGGDSGSGGGGDCGG